MGGVYWLLAGCCDVEPTQKISVKATYHLLYITYCIICMHLYKQSKGILKGQMLALHAQIWYVSLMYKSTLSKAN